MKFYSKNLCRCDIFIRIVSCVILTYLGSNENRNVFDSKILKPNFLHWDL